MRVVWTDEALRAIEQAYEYLYQFNPRAAEHIAASIRAEGLSLANFPHRGRPVPGTDMREWVSAYPYIIRYRVAANEVVILRVRHSARRPTTP
jgi:toxin ParE1/3/4